MVKNVEIEIKRVKNMVYLGIKEMKKGNYNSKDGRNAGTGGMNTETELSKKSHGVKSKQKYTLPLFHSENKKEK